MAKQYSKEEHYIRLTIAKVLSKNKDVFNPLLYSLKPDIKYLKAFNRLSHEEQIDTLYNIMVWHGNLIRTQYIENLKDIKIPILGSIRVRRYRIHAIKRAMALRKENPNITGVEMYQAISKEIAQEKKNKKRQNLLKFKRKE